MYNEDVLFRSFKKIVLNDVVVICCFDRVMVRIGIEVVSWEIFFCKSLK